MPSLAKIGLERLIHVNPVGGQSIHYMQLDKDFEYWLYETLSVAEQEWFEMFIPDMWTYEGGPFAEAYIESLIEGEIYVIGWAGGL